MKFRKRLTTACLLVTCVSAHTARAQVPPHYPGTICFTQQFFCFLPAAQYPGSLCYCATPYGAVPGRAG
ncbi:MAG: hypothetical protein JWO52_6943 [Gammaproteobacteria bacterium]|jgi:hypothetical protein|nr:hypothetical protein [Gammaproteobacteria bacterium]